MRIAVIHTSDRPFPSNLWIAVNAWKPRIFTDDSHTGAMWNHLRALEWSTIINEPVLVLEDDAIPSPGIDDALNLLSDSLTGPWDAISLYLGRGAPVGRQPEISHIVDEAKHAYRGGNTSRIIHPAHHLYHAVAYVLPAENAAMIHRRLSTVKLQRDIPVDSTIEHALGGTPTIGYMLPSPFDHDDSLPSTVQHRGRRPEIPRTAWWFK